MLLPSIGGTKNFHKPREETSILSYRIRCLRNIVKTTRQLFPQQGLGLCLEPKLNQSVCQEETHQGGIWIYYINIMLYGWYCCKFWRQRQFFSFSSTLYTSTLWVLSHFLCLEIHQKLAFKTPLRLKLPPFITQRTQRTKRRCFETASSFRSMSAAQQSEQQFFPPQQLTPAPPGGDPQVSPWHRGKLNPSWVSWLCPEVSSLLAMPREVQEGAVCQGG